MGKSNFEVCIAVVGLGYVGLPLALEFGKKYKTIGYDLSDEKVAACNQSLDINGELGAEQFQESVYFEATNNPRRLQAADYIIIAVPTPVDDHNVPEFSALEKASEIVGANLKRDTTVIYESTVYPGATEEICLPVLEAKSGFSLGDGLSLGYSPERINPGDKVNVLSNIVKIVAGHDHETTKILANLYGSIIPAGIFQASSIQVAEAAKAIENAQRDLNIAFVNELAILFDKLEIDTEEVLRASRTKWNFLDFRPGLVGGHCIGVDPFYLTYKAQAVGYHPELILAGRRINDGMPKFVAENTIKYLMKSSRSAYNAKVIVMGATFKEDCSDFRNSKVLDLVRELEDYGLEVDIYDPLINPEKYEKSHQRKLVSWEGLPTASAIVLATPHKQIKSMELEDLCSKLIPDGLFVDVKSAFDRKKIEQLGFNFWQL